MTDTTLISKGKSTRVISTGSIGPPGPKGATGSIGPQGIRGAIGPIGDISNLQLFLLSTPDADGLDAAVSSANAAGGGIVVLPSIVDITRDTITYTHMSNVHIRGQGMGTSRVVLHGTSTSRAIWFENATKCSASYFSIQRDAKVWLGSSAAAAVAFQGGSVNCEIHHVEAFWHSAAALLLMGNKESSIHHCHVHDCFGDGTHIGGYTSVGIPTWGCSTHDNVIHDMGDDGVGISAEGNGLYFVEVYNNICWQTGANGVGVYGGVGVDVHDNIVWNTSGSGVLLNNSSDPSKGNASDIRIHDNILISIGAYNSPNIWFTFIPVAGICVQPDSLGNFSIDNLSITNNTIFGSKFNYIVVGSSIGPDSTHGVRVGTVIIEGNLCDGGILTSTISGTNVAGGSWTQAPASNSGLGYGIDVEKAEVLRINNNIIKQAATRSIFVRGAGAGLTWTVQGAYGIRYYYEVLDNTIFDPYKMYTAGDQIITIQCGSGPVFRCGGNTILDPNNNGAAQSGGFAGGHPIALFVSDDGMTADYYVSGNHYPKGVSPTWINWTDWRLVNTAFQPPFTNGWQNVGSGTEPAQFRKDSDGLVHIRGNIRNGSIGTSVFTLPVGYRPAYNIVRPVVSIGAFGAVSVVTDGTVVASIGSSTSFWLDGISFYAET